MRQSKRETALEAAKRVIQRDGVTALTYESVAVESGLTKGGLVYHFPSREAMLLALHQHVADQWEAALRQEAGAAPEVCTPDERFAAYTRASAEPDRAELLLMLEAAGNDELSGIWNAVMERWAPPMPNAESNDDDLRRSVAMFAADGLWFNEASGGYPLDPEVRARLIQLIIRWAVGN